MKNLLKKIIPTSIIKWYRRIKSLKFAGKNTKDIFTNIYTTNHWKSSESISGTGSELIQTESLIKDINKLILEADIKSILDIPCGDFKWMQKVDLSKVDYTGADIVENLITDNSEKYKNIKNAEFKVLDLINDQLPKCDLVIVRDCLVHLSYEDILKSIKNIKSSGSKYILTTTFTDYHSNYNIITGDWRRLNLQDDPISFPKPTIIINENCTEDNGNRKDKSMALWEISRL